MYSEPLQTIRAGTTTRCEAVMVLIHGELPVLLSCLVRVRCLLPCALSNVAWRERDVTNLLRALIIAFLLFGNDIQSGGD